MDKIAGIDGCKGGWVSIESDGQRYSSAFIASLEDYFDRPDAPSMVAIDIPIGLHDNLPRACDVEARRMLKGRSSSVFNSPLRPTLRARDRVEAATISLQLSGKSVGAQAFGIYPKVLEVDSLLQDFPELRERVFEVHPELCFAMWAGAPMKHPKRTPAGFGERFDLIEDHFGDGAFHAVRSKLPKALIADDDVLDAFAALRTAERIRSGQARTCPERVELDSTGLRAAMWY